MENNFTTLAEKLEEQESLITEATKHLIKTIEKEKEKLEESYNDSVPDVLNLLKISMETQGKKLVNKELTKLSSDLESKSNDILAKFESLNKEKANYTWLWATAFAVWTVAMIVLGSYLSQNPQILKSESKTITIKEGEN